jgi:hypothetical protein
VLRERNSGWDDNSSGITLFVEWRSPGNASPGGREKTRKEVVMRRSAQFIGWIGLTIAGAVLLSHCGNGGGDGTPPAAGTIAARDDDHRRRGTVVGRVVEESGVGVAEATVRLDDVTTLTASDGTYTLQEVPLGRQTVTAEKEGRTTSVAVVVRPGRITFAPDLVLPPPLPGEVLINVHVVDEFSR